MFSGWAPEPPRSSSPLASSRAGDREREEEEEEEVGCLKHPRQPQLHRTKVRAQREGEGSGTFYFFLPPTTMSVLIATQLKIDTSTPSRRVRGPFSMHGTLQGNVGICG